MTGQELIDELYAIIDDENTISSTRALLLINTAYDRVCAKRVWHFLDSEDTSETISATRSYDLASDFLYPRTVKLYDSASGNFDDPLKPVPFRHRHKYEGVKGYYYIDLKNSALKLTWTPEGSDIGKTLYIDYAYQPSQLTTATSPVFNRAFHMLLAYEAARMFWYSEQDEKDRSWNNELNNEYLIMFGDMVTWDTHLDAGMEPDIVPQEAWVDLEDGS